MAKSITTQELKKQLSATRSPTLIDVRRKSEYEASPEEIPGATWRDPEEIDSWTGDLPSDNPIVVYCARGGSVSQGVAERLHQQGFQTLFLEGGIKAWRENGQTGQ